MVSPLSREASVGMLLTKATLVETHILLEDLADACLDGARKQLMETVSTVPLLIPMLYRLLHHGHVLKCGPRSWRTKTAATA
jgi:hypothetical protein